MDVHPPKNGIKIGIDPYPWYGNTGRQTPDVFPVNIFSGASVGSLGRVALRQNQGTFAGELPTWRQLTNGMREIHWNPPMNFPWIPHESPMNFPWDLLSTRPGQHTKSYRTSPYFWWVNPLFRLGHLPVRKLLVCQRVISSLAGKSTDMCLITRGWTIQQESHLPV